jgi:hypothetical protein
MLMAVSWPRGPHTRTHTKLTGLVCGVMFTRMSTHVHIIVRTVSLHV